MNAELVVILLTAVAGIIGTLLAAEWSANRTREQMAAQWDRDERVARRNQAKDAARAILDEVIAAAERFTADNTRRRIRELNEIMADEDDEFSVADPDPPEWVVAPSRAEVEPHYRAIRRRTVEIAEAEMAAWARHLAAVLWDPDDILRLGYAKHASEIGQCLVDTAERVIGAFVRDEPVPAVDEVPEFSRLLAGIEAMRRHDEDMLEAWLAEQATDRTDGRAAVEVVATEPLPDTDGDER